MGQLIRDTIHCLKTWSPYYSEVERGIKTFEVRRDDRGFSVGDVLVLQEFDAVNKRYTGNMVSRLVIYKLDGDQFGIEAGFCVLGLGPLPLDTKVECEQRPTTVCQCPLPTATAEAHPQADNTGSPKLPLCKTCGHPMFAHQWLYKSYNFCPECGRQLRTGA